MADTDEQFLNRWSRRKHEKRQKTALADVEPMEEPVSAGPAGSLPVSADDQSIPPDLPDIDSLDKDSNYAVFLKEGVPEALTRLALRKLWRSDPVLAVLDGLNDYDEDYHTPIALAKKLVTGLQKTADGAQDAATKDEEPAHEKPAALRDDPSEPAPPFDAEETASDAADSDDVTEGDDKEIG